MKFWVTKKRLFAFHGWLGVVLGLPLFIICLAGSCAVMAPEIDRMISSDARLTPPSDPAATPLSWGALLGKIEAACPGGEVFLMNAADSPDGAWSATVNYSPRDSRVVLFDPYTGQVQSQRTPFSVQSFFRIFHKQLFILSGPFWPHGRVIVCAFAMVLLVTAATGLMFYKSWWKHLLRLRVGKGMRTFLSDFHRFVGVWTFLLAILFAVTGLWYLTERLMEDFGLAEHDPQPALSDEVRALRPPLLERLPLDELAERARRSLPLAKIGMVILGNQPNAVTGFYFEGGGLLPESGVDRVYLDPYTGEIVGKIESGNLNIGRKLESLVNPLHFGRFGGWVTKSIWTAAGLAISAGILTGVWMYGRRMGKGGTAISKRWTRAALVMNLLILGIAGFSTVSFIRGMIAGPRNPFSYQLMGTGSAGPWTVEAFREGQRGKETGRVKFRFASQADPNFRRIFAWPSREAKPENPTPVRGSRNVFYVKMKNPSGDFRLGIESWDGTLHEVSFAKSPADTHWITPPAAQPTSWTVWTIVGTFFLAIGAPTVIWLIRLW
jgi:uncharacterized iron-regulated membrane protein